MAALISAAASPVIARFRREVAQAIAIAQPSRHDALGVQVAIEILGQRACRGISAARALCSGTCDDQIEGIGDIGRATAQRCRRLVHHLEQQVHHRLVLKWRLPRQQVVERRAEAVDVAAAIQPSRLTACLLRRHIGRRADDRSIPSAHAMRWHRGRAPVRSPSPPAAAARRPAAPA